MKLVDKLFLSLGFGILFITAIAAASTEAWGMMGLWVMIGVWSGVAALVLFISTVVGRVRS